MVQPVTVDRPHRQWIGQLLLKQPLLPWFWGCPVSGQLSDSLEVLLDLGH